MTTQDAFEQQKIDIALKILTLSRNELLISYAYLNSALGSFRYISSALIDTIGTDGTYIYFNPDFILERYQQQAFWVNRAHIHAILHCLYKHPFYIVNEDIGNWNLACEIAVDYVLDGFSGKYIPHFRKPEKQQVYLEFEKINSIMTAQNIYRQLLQYSPDKIEFLNDLFIFDSHLFWAKEQESQPDSELSKQTETSQSEQEQYSQDQSSSKLPGLEKVTNQPSQDEGQGMLKQGQANQNQIQAQDQANSARQVPMNQEQAMEYWKQIGQSIEMDLKTFHKDRGDQPGNLIDSIDLVNRDKHDYTKFLSKFAILKEEMLVDIDSFDYIFYTYGLSLYKNMPLIEPLEYKDVNKVYDFVIAIDTSGSIDNNLVKQFLNKTYGILKSKESFHKKINLHIIQCDTMIHEDKHIKTHEEFEAYANNFSALGRGGTDFRPVFTYVEKLIKEKRFHKLKGLLYFTDGWGVFPKKSTPYDTAFVFIKDDHYNDAIPSWAIKLVLDPDDLKN